MCHESGGPDTVVPPYILPICPNFVHQIVSAGMAGRCHGAMLGLAPLFIADYNHHLKCGDSGVVSVYHHHPAQPLVSCVLSSAWSHFSAT